MNKVLIIKIIAVLTTLTAGVTVPMHNSLENNYKLVQNQETETVIVSGDNEKETSENINNNHDIVEQEATGAAMSEETIQNSDEDAIGNEQVTEINESIVTETNNNCNKVEIITKEICVQTIKPDISENNKPGTTEKQTTERQTTERQTTKNEVTTTKGNINDNVPSGTYVQQVVDLVNKERTKNGLSKLTLDTNLQKAAQIRAKEIEQSFSHTRPNGTNFSTVLSELNISYRGSGENIAWGQTSPEAVMNAWMNSSGHRANILNRSFTKIGVGYYQNSAGRKYWSQLFTY